MLDELLAYKLRGNALSAAIQIDRCRQNKKYKRQHLEELTRTLSVECKTDSLEEFSADWATQTFFYHMFKELREREYKLAEELFTDVRCEIDNLLAILSNSKNANIGRGFDFCIELHRMAMVYNSGPVRRSLAA